MLGRKDAAKNSLKEGLKRLRRYDKITAKERGYIETYMARMDRSFEQVIFSDPTRQIQVSLDTNGISKFILRRFPPAF